MKQEPLRFRQEVVRHVEMPYLLALPTDYGASEGPWPLLMFLHGAGERGDDVEIVKRNGPPRLIAKGQELPFIVVSPQCSTREYWPQKVDELSALLDHIIDTYYVDARRVYLTGISMGGYGTWHLAAAEPERFAALVPICGGFGQAVHHVCALKDIPIWVFHGARDDVVPVTESERLVKALVECGGNVRFTIYPEAGHDSWTQTYNDPTVFEWLLKQSR